MTDIWLPPQLGLIGPSYPLKDKHVTSNETLPSRWNFFRTLTVDSGFTLTGLAGGTFIFVQDLADIAGTISVNYLGAKSQAITVDGGVGYGGGVFGAQFQIPLNSATPYNEVFHLQMFMPTTTSGLGDAGSAWPSEPGVVTLAPSIDAPTDGMSLVKYLVAMMLARPNDHATYGAIGGGGGSAPKSVSGGTAPGFYGGSGNASSGPGSGFGSGGAGVLGSAISGVVGRGGGVLALVCGMLSGAGTLEAKGQDATSGGGAGGGGACAAVYNKLGATSPSVTAAGGGASGGGGVGGAGLTKKDLINMGL